MINVTGMSIGFTGSRNAVSEFQRDRILDILQSLTDAKRFITGGCVGMDHLVGVTMLKIAPDKEHVVIVPANRSRIAAWWRPYGDAVKVIEMPPESDYRARNREIVLRSSALVAFPSHAESHPACRRSGTWQTIRMAEALKPMVYPLDAM